MRFVINASPLIFLAKLNALDLLRGHNIIVPLVVKEEILSKENIEKERLEIFLRRKHVSVASPKKEIRFSQSLGKGEMQVIQIAIEKKISHVILDDRRAWSFAKIHRLKVQGTLGIILISMKKGILKKKQAKQHILDLLRNGFYIDEKILLEVLNIIDKERIT